jgi:molybdate transport system substrate-binding protein
MQVPTRHRAGRRLLILAALALMLGVLSSCTEARVAEPAESELTIFAAASLTEVFPRIDGEPRYNFAGSNTLLQQIEQGAPADVFASANSSYPQQLFEAGTCERPVVYATNSVVVIVPKDNPAGIMTVFDLTRPDVDVVVAGAGVPVGDYTRTILRSLGIAEQVTANVVSNEPDVKGVTGKVALGQADAGFVYRTDVGPVADEVSFVRIPSSAQPSVQYSLCVLSSSTKLAAARAFQARVLGPIGRGKLSGALFGLPPKQP